MKRIRPGIVVAKLLRKLGIATVRKRPPVGNEPHQHAIENVARPGNAHKPRPNNQKNAGNGIAGKQHPPVDSVQQTPEHPGSPTVCSMPKRHKRQQSITLAPPGDQAREAHAAYGGLARISPPPSSPSFELDTAPSSASKSRASSSATGARAAATYDKSADDGEPSPRETWEPLERRFSEMDVLTQKSSASYTPPTRARQHDVVAPVDPLVAKRNKTETNHAACTTVDRPPSPPATADDADTELANALGDAASAWDAAAVTTLVSVRQADVNGRTSSGQTPLIAAVTRPVPDDDDALGPPNMLVITTLLDLDADVNGRDLLGRTALHIAAASHSRAIANLLLRHGADANARDCTGATPLMLALESDAPSRPAFVDFLLEKDVDCNVRDALGRTALFRIVANVPDAPGHALVLQLTDKGRADVNLADATQTTPAMIGNHVPALASMPDIHLDLQDADGSTALMRAVKRASLPNIKAILAAGCSPGIQDAQGRTALHIACVRGKMAIIKLLLDAGAPVDTQDGRGRTPIAVARNKGHIDILRVLAKTLESREAALSSASTS